uniref:Uncharacterized protein n=1 Tax=Salix viminalis TaxID=40686 RepID=A0A6N2LRG1_SALVM
MADIDVDGDCESFSIGGGCHEIVHSQVRLWLVLLPAWVIWEASPALFKPNLSMDSRLL